MASSDTLTFDADPPHRAGLSELGGGAKENSTVYPPDPVKHPTAQDFNQMSQQLSAVNRVMPLAILWVRIVAGVPSIFALQAAGTNVVTGSFTVVDVSVGETLISWKTGTGVGAPALPAAVGVRAAQTDDTAIDRLRAILTTSGSDPAARVKSFLGAAATDCNFCLEIY
jgi:hypothetical protein